LLCKCSVLSCHRTTIALYCRMRDLILTGQVHLLALFILRPRARADMNISQGFAKVLLAPSHLTNTIAPVRQSVSGGGSRACIPIPTLKDQS